MRSCSAAIFPCVVLLLCFQFIQLRHGKFSDTSLENMERVIESKMLPTLIAPWYFTIVMVQARVGATHVFVLLGSR
jgi:hypothetical protein